MVCAVFGIGVTRRRAIVVGRILARKNATLRHNAAGDDCARNSNNRGGSLRPIFVVVADAQLAITAP